MSLSVNSGSDLLALDSHVHFYDLADLPGLLESAWQSFRRAIGAQAAARPFSGVLVLTEPQSRPTFAALQQKDSDTAGICNGLWTLAATEEKISLRATRDDGGTLFLLSGQQIVTRENLEVLSLLAQPIVADGLSLAETVTEVLRSAACRCCPGASASGSAGGGRSSAISWQRAGKPRSFSETTAAALPSGPPCRSSARQNAAESPSCAVPIRCAAVTGGGAPAVSAPC